MSGLEVKQLGQTEVAKELIPGESTQVRAVATTLKDLEKVVDGAFTTFKSATVPSWQGFGGVAYESIHDGESARWKSYIKTLSSTASTLETYAGKLDAAQVSAADAIAKWKKGEEQRQAAFDTWESERLAYNAKVENFAIGDPFPIRPALFPSDPGVALRSEAEDILEKARSTLDEAGNAAVAAIGALDGSKSEGTSDWLGSEGSASGPSINLPGFMGGGFGDDPRAGKNGQYEGRNWEDFYVGLGKAEGSAWVYKAEGGVEDYWGPVKMNADGTFEFLSAHGSAEAAIDKDGLRIGADGRVVLVGAEGDVGAEWGHVNAGLHGEASAEANAGGKVLIGNTGLHAGGEVFAGARAAADAEVEVAGVGAKVGVEGWAGIGASADFNVGFEEGKFSIGGSGGVAFGVGGKFSGEITIDFGAVGDALDDAGEWIGGWFD